MANSGEITNMMQVNPEIRVGTDWPHGSPNFNWDRFDLSKFLLTI